MEDSVVPPKRMVLDKDLYMTWDEFECIMKSGVRIDTNGFRLFLGNPKAD